jgi:hypothetical protein
VHSFRLWALDLRCGRAMHLKVVALFGKGVLCPLSTPYVPICQMPRCLRTWTPLGRACSLGPRAEKFQKFQKFHSWDGAGRKEMGEAIQVVISRAFFLIFPCNHIINIYKKIFWPRSKRERNFPFFFTLHKRATPILPPYTLSPPTLSAHSSAHPSLTHPPIPPPTYPPFKD